MKNIVIIGAGAVGIGIGAGLASQQAEVDFIARGEVKNAIKSSGIKRSGIFGDIEIAAGKVGAYDDYSVLPKDIYDYVIIATKSTANAEVAESLYDNMGCMKSECKIVFVQNGMGYEAPFLEYFDTEKIYHGRVITGFKKNGLNESEITVHQDPIAIGSIYGCDIECVKPLADMIKASGLPAMAKEHIGQDLWAKFIYNTTLNPIGAILKMTYGELAESEYAHAIMDILIEETFNLIQATGSTTYWADADAYREAFYGAIVPATANHKSSTLQDIENHRKTEIDFHNFLLLWG